MTKEETAATLKATLANRFNGEARDFRLSDREEDALDRAGLSWQDMFGYGFVETDDSICTPVYRVKVSAVLQAAPELN
jgi:hypothetical protein